MTANNKPTCGELYKKAIGQYRLSELEREIFAMGFVAGQAEKVYLGASPAAMFRPSDAFTNRLRGIVDDMCKVYGLYVVTNHYDDPRPRESGSVTEFWISRTYKTLSRMQDWPVNSPQWHAHRAMLCGIPIEECDIRFHERPGYLEVCDQ